MLAMRGMAVAAAALVLLSGCHVRLTDTTASLTSCAQLVPGCEADRLPDVTLTSGQTNGALGPVDGMDLTGVISFDDALKRAGAEDDQPTAKTVQVTLGSANADQLHWGHGTNLYYAIEWDGVCAPVLGPSPFPGASPLPSCAGSEWSTVIDAHTGAFIVGGT